jgi:hypothetical protein
VYGVARHEVGVKMAKRMVSEAMGWDDYLVPFEVAVGLVTG